MVAALVLAQIDAKSAAEGLGRDFLPWAIVGLCIALAFVVRWALSLIKQIQTLQAEAATALVKAASDRSEREREHAKELREVLMQVMPLSMKMAEGLELLERLTDRGPRHA